MDPRCRLPHHLTMEPSGFRGPESLLWRAVRPIEAWNAHPAGSIPERVAIATGTNLRLDQTDWCIQGCASGDVIVGQRFFVMNGPLAGCCVEFTQYTPKAFTAWVPDGLVVAGATTASGGRVVANR